ncbi:hypothetical protein ABEB36_007966 [Hypothenemus hampei]|uniref:Uncharacterized protein n=1 Tax=Hypothenemus hampei TaxID=57062 RepID=A0ABD1EKS3_HYPHA
MYISPDMLDSCLTSIVLLPGSALISLSDSSDCEVSILFSSVWIIFVVADLLLLRILHAIDPDLCPDLPHSRQEGGFLHSLAVCPFSRHLRQTPASLFPFSGSWHPLA